MSKKILIIGLIIIGVVLISGFLVKQNQIPKIFFCDSDVDCVLAYTGSDICAGCDLSSEWWKCVSVEESEKIKDERRKNFEKSNILCYPCTMPRQEYICICEDGICKKIEKQAEQKIGAPLATTLSSGPHLVSPPNKTTTDNSQITFGWYNIEGAEKYLIQIDNISDFSSPEIEKYVDYSQFKPENPLSDGSHYWRVKTIYKTGEQSDWSSIFKITIFTIFE